MNALKHGHRSRATIAEYQRIRRVLRRVARNIAILRAHIRARDQAARPQIKFKPWYARVLAFAKPDLSADLSSVALAKEEAHRAKAHCPSRPRGVIGPG
jgi:hypothetical protein